MYTANTMASAIEALGMTLPYNSSNPALSKQKKKNQLKQEKLLRFIRKRY